MTDAERKKRILVLTLWVVVIGGFAIPAITFFFSEDGHLPGWALWIAGGIVSVVGATVYFARRAVMRIDQQESRREQTKSPNSD